jgi:hypothetical protein
MATEEDKQAARDRLAELTGRYEAAETHLEQVRKEVTEEIAAILMARTLGPSEVTRLSPFERQHVGRIAKAAGVPPLREATVVSRAKATAPKGSRPAAVAPRQQVTQAVPKPEPIDLTGIFPEVAALPYELATRLAVTAETRQPKWVEKIRQEYPDADERRLRYLIINVGYRQGRTPPELAARPRPRLSVDNPLTGEEATEFATLARSHANEEEVEKLNRAAGKAVGESGDFAVMHTALIMGLLKHDEVYGERPVSSEETSKP